MNRANLAALLTLGHILANQGGNSISENEVRECRRCPNKVAPYMKYCDECWKFINRKPSAQRRKKFGKRL